jgi:monoamine oxidase
MQRLRIINEAVSESSPQYDYVIVGAGISGIQAADILTSRPNNKILILEAQTVLGGRIGSLSVGDLQEAKRTPWIWNNIEKYRNAYIEAGATWIEERHLVTLELCKQFGIELREQHSAGNCVYLAEKPATSQQLMKNSPYADKIKEVI